MRGIARNTADAVENYCEASIEAITKQSPKSFHQKASSADALSELSAKLPRKYSK